MGLRKLFQSFLLVGTLSVSSCASSQDHNINPDYIYDPIEPINRGIFSFNEGLDYILLDPLTEAYRFIVPDAFRIAIANFLSNLKSPVYLANELLQGDLDGAGLVTQRFVLNTLTGFGGVLDTASWEGMTYVPEDFGQTLAVWGVDEGPYLVLPILGPSNVRDTVGFVGDMAMDPVNWYIWNEDKDDLGYIRAGATLLTTKDQIYDLQQDLQANSFDYYAATRSVWNQRRKALINDQNAEGRSYVEYE